jgi:hypothetical protein
MMLVSAAALIGLWPQVVEAAARVIAPSGWGESAGAAPDAQRRASRWQEALNLRLAQVISAPGDDGFAATVAVFEHPSFVSEQMFASEAAAVAALVTAVTAIVGDDPPEQTELRSTDEGATVVWGRWTIDDLSYECVLAPSGGNASVVIAAVLASQAASQQRILTAIFAGLEGVSAPMPRFSLLGWRLGSIFIWLTLALGLHAAMLPFGDRDHDHGQAGRRAARLSLALVVLGSGLAVVILREREQALLHAGSSVSALAVWIGVSGMIVVGLHFLVASRVDRGPVQSAPSSGAFASGVYSNVDVLRSSVSRSGVRPRIAQQREIPSAAQSSARIIIDESERE